MVEKYQHTFRVPSSRLAGWDYASDGLYYVTVCTKDRRCWFGDCRDGKMVLSEVGQIVQRVFENIPMIYSCAFLDQFIVMPNHLHAIIGIQKSHRPIDVNHVETPHWGVSRNETKPLSILQPQSLGSIIGQFKSIATKLIRGFGTEAFAWQPRYHDHVIRNEQALENIRAYIVNNPTNWDKDEHNLDRIDK